MLALLTKLALLLPVYSPAFYVNAVSGLAVVLYVTGVWHIAPNVSANFFALVVLVNLVFDLFRHWIDQALGGLD